MSGLTVSSASSSYHHPLVTQPPQVDTRKYFCPFLERGYCREASRCNFSHDNRGSTKIPTDYCHFYLANQCLYGQDCKFRHCEPPISSSSSSTTNATITTLATPQSNSPQSGSPLRYGDRQHFHHHHMAAAPALSQLAAAVAITSSSSSPISGSSKAILSLASGSCSSTSGTAPNNHHATTASTAQAAATSKPLALVATYSSHFTKEPNSSNNNNPTRKDYPPLCPYSSTTGECPFPDGKCSYLHGLDCDLCGHPCLHPHDLNQQREHRDDCLREHEREMELSFAVQRSKDKVCGICMDTVVEKKPITSSRFGILEKCNHIFCLDCIRKWRGTKQFETRTIRACPECRVSSDFVVPSKYWVEDQEDKDKLIHDYKAALRSKPCKYFDEGNGECPFAGSCFYKHAYPDGRIAKLENPKPRRRLYGARGATSLSVANYMLWNILAADDDDWSIDDEHESLYVDPPDFGSSDEEDLDDDLDEPYFL